MNKVREQFILRCQEESNVFDKFVLACDDEHTIPKLARYNLDLYYTYKSKSNMYDSRAIKEIIVESIYYKTHNANESDQSFIDHVNEYYILSNSIRRLVDLFAHLSYNLDDDIYACQYFISDIIKNIFEYAKDKNAVQSLINIIETKIES